MQAYGDNLLVQEIDQPDDAVIKTPNGKHPWALKVLDVGDLVNAKNRGTTIEEGDYVAASGQLNGLGNSDVCTIHKSQVKAIVGEDEL